MDPLYDPSIIPTLYSKIGVLIVRVEMLSTHNMELLEEIRRLQAIVEENGEPEKTPGPGGET